jgi:hypothetical protein
MSGFSPDTIELLERAQRAIEQAEKLRAERERLAGVARQQGYLVAPACCEASPQSNAKGKAAVPDLN